ncbi:ribbon-helix-helix domain-containing protein [Blastomonas sp. SL216]|uniref:ribbon-helix-helix domain-containing protein n=1 Tax=Blastomonas sp. SL216 TaxID=2995169 RepID=UPI00406A7A03
MSIRATTKRKGRPATGKGVPISVRLQPDQLERLDQWIEDDGGRFSRPEAIRQLLEHAWGRTVASRGIKELPSRLGDPI